MVSFFAHHLNYVGEILQRFVSKLGISSPHPNNPDWGLRFIPKTKMESLSVWHHSWQREGITYSHWHSRQDLIARTPRRQHWQAAPLRTTQETDVSSSSVLYTALLSYWALFSIYSLNVLTLILIEYDRFTLNRLKKMLTMWQIVQRKLRCLIKCLNIVSVILHCSFKCGWFFASFKKFDN